MSFILDALKKSESDRQRQSGPALFEVKVAPPRTRLPLWAIAIALLLVVNLAIVAWMMLRHPAARADAANPAAQPANLQGNLAVPAVASASLPQPPPMAATSAAAPGAPASGPGAALPSTANTAPLAVPGAADDQNPPPTVYRSTRSGRWRRARTCRSCGWTCTSTRRVPRTASS
jgi:general secretion pathway protein B